MFCHGLKKKEKKTLKKQEFTLGFPAANYLWIINAKCCHQAWSLDGRLPGKLSTPGHARRGVWKGKRKKNTLIVEGQSPTLTSQPASVPAPGGHGAPSASQPPETTPREVETCSQEPASPILASSYLLALAQSLSAKIALLPSKLFWTSWDNVPLTCSVRSWTSQNSLGWDVLLPGSCSEHQSLAQAVAANTGA